jgi:hypothetical protein
MKEIKRVDGNTTNEFTGNVEIRDLEDYLEEMKKLNYTHVNISYDAGYEEVCFFPYYNRFETDQEYETRMQRIADTDKNIKLYELRELKRLKEKYEKE